MLLERIKLSAVLLLLMAAIGFFYYFAEWPTLYRVSVLLAVVVAALGLLYFTAAGRGGWNFMRVAQVEVQKVVWPTRVETVQTTMVVLIVVCLVGILLWLFDMFLIWGLKQLG